MAKRTARLEGIGEFQEPGEASRQQARRFFFERLAEIRPRFLATLEEGPYQVILKENIQLVPGSETPTEKLRQKLQKLREAVEIWCAQWNLEDDWCRRLAYDTVLAWIRTPRKRHKWAPEDWEWLAPVSFPRGPKFTFAFRPWNYILETRSNYETGLRLYLEKRLQEHLETAEQEAIEMYGLVRSRTKREPIHFYWLARRFLGETAADIARFSPKPPTARAVQKAIKSLADHLQLTLPPQKTKTRAGRDRSSVD